MSSPVMMSRENLRDIFNDMESTMRSIEELSEHERGQRHYDDLNPPGISKNKTKNTVGSYLRAAMDAAMKNTTEESNIRKNTVGYQEDYEEIEEEKHPDREKIEYLREYARQVLATKNVKSSPEYILDEFYERMQHCLKIKQKLEVMLNVVSTSSASSAVSKWKFVRQKLEGSPKKTEWFRRRIVEMEDIENNFRDGVTNSWRIVSTTTATSPLQQFNQGIGVTSKIQGEILDRNISRISPQTLVKMLTPFAIPGQVKQNTNRLVALLYAYDRNLDEKISFKEFSRASRHFVGANEIESENFFAACTSTGKIESSGHIRISYMLTLLKRAAGIASRPGRIGDICLERSTKVRVAKSTLYTSQILPLFGKLAKAVGVSFCGSNPMRCRYRTREELVSDAKDRVKSLTYELHSWNKDNTSFRDILESHFDEIEVHYAELCAILTCIRGSHCVYMKRGLRRILFDDVLDRIDEKNQSWSLVAKMMSLELRLLSFLELHFQGETRVRVSDITEKLASDEDLILSIREVFDRDPLLSLRAFTTLYMSPGDFLSLMNSSNEHALSFIDGSMDDNAPITRRRVESVESTADSSVDEDLKDILPDASKITASYRALVSVEERRIMNDVFGIESDEDVVVAASAAAADDDDDDDAQEVKKEKLSKTNMRTETKEQVLPSSLPPLPPQLVTETKDDVVEIIGKTQCLVSDSSIREAASSAVRAANNSKDPYLLEEEEEAEEKKEEEEEEELEVKDEKEEMREDTPLPPPIHIEVIKNIPKQSFIVESVKLPPHFMIINDGNIDETNQDDNDSIVSDVLSEQNYQQQSRVVQAYRFIFDVANRHVRADRLNYKEISRVLYHSVFQVKMEDFCNLLEEYDFVFNLEFFSLIDHEENDALSLQEAVSGTMFAIRLRQVFLESACYEGTDEVPNLAMASSLLNTLRNDNDLVEGLKLRDAYPILIILDRLVDVMGVKKATISVRLHFVFIYISPLSLSLSLSNLQPTHNNNNNNSMAIS